MQILPLCYPHLVAASHSYTCAQDGLDTVQLALVVFFLLSTSTNRYTTCTHGGHRPPTTYAGGIFLGALPHLLMHICYRSEGGWLWSSWLSFYHSVLFPFHARSSLPHLSLGARNSCLSSLFDIISVIISQLM